MGWKMVGGRKTRNNDNEIQMYTFWYFIFCGSAADRCRVNFCLFSCCRNEDAIECIKENKCKEKPTKRRERKTQNRFVALRDALNSEQACDRKQE